jgi:glycosyltransferase involved in cell wall biosynthesis
MSKTYVLDARTATTHFPGICRYASCLAEGMVPELLSHERLVLLRDPRPESPWQVPAAGGRLSVVDVPASPFSLRQQWSVPSLLRTLGASLYHSCYYLMPYLRVVPTVLTVHDLIPTVLPDEASFRARLVFRWATALALRSSEAVIAGSESTRADVLRAYNIDADWVSVIPYAAGAAFHPRSADEVHAARRSYQLPDRYVFYLGSNKPHKNLSRLVEAWAWIRDSLPGGTDWRLVIAGEWDRRYPQARLLAEGLGLGAEVQWLGRVEEKDLPALYSGAGVFIYPSLYEGFGLPVLEAMACGVAVACSGSSALAEVAGDAGLRFDPMSVDAIARALRRLLADDDLRQQLREKGLDRAARFSWRRTASETLAVSRKLLSAGKGKA